MFLCFEECFCFFYNNTTQTKEPVRQGLVSMTGTFIDTILICTMTGLSIVLTGAWQVEGIEGVQVTTYAFQNGLPLPQKLTASG